MFVFRKKRRKNPYSSLKKQALNLFMKHGAKKSREKDHPHLCF